MKYCYRVYKSCIGEQDVCLAIFNSKEEADRFLFMANKIDRNETLRPSRTDLMYIKKTRNLSVLFDYFPGWVLVEVDIEDGIIYINAVEIESVLKENIGDLYLIPDSICPSTEGRFDLATLEMFKSVKSIY